MTTLEAQLRATIAADGPLDLGTYMEACLADPDYGYYQHQTPFGVEGDFITAPEISGLFGEMCGLYLAHMYEVTRASLPASAGHTGAVNNDSVTNGTTDYDRDGAAMTQGAMAQAVVTELGPGRGTLMRDMQHVWRQLMPPLSTHPVHFVETSPALRRQQADLMQDHGGTMQWHDNAASLPDAPLFGIANEFFDALPVRQYVRRDGNWHQRMVGLDGDALGFVTGPDADSAIASRLPATAEDGEIAEFCPAADAVMDQLAARVAMHGGAVLIIDYGQAGNKGDSLQAVAAHKPVDPFFEPGKADLSHWVDFNALAERATTAGARLVGPVPQGRFLMRIGLATRAEQAASTADPETRRALLAAIDRLTSPAQMGEAFKVALLIPAGDGVPPGFETDEDAR